LDRCILLSDQKLVGAFQSWLRTCPEFSPPRSHRKDTRDKRRGSGVVVESQSRILYRIQDRLA
jgi:hypothetical protein